MEVRTFIDIYTLRNATWGGAKENIKFIYDDELELILNILEDLSVNWDMTTLNDFFWFDTDTWCEWLGFRDYEEFYEERCKDFHIDE